MEQESLLTFDAFISHWGQNRGDHIALSEEDREWTYTDLEERTARAVSLLISMGLGKGDRIVWIGKIDLYFTLFYGAARVGVVD